MLPSSLSQVRRAVQRRLICALPIAAFIASAANAQTQLIKADNADDLTLSTSWVDGIVPGLTDIALWDATVTAANDVTLGGPLNWLGIRLTNPGGPVTITAGSLLTLGTAGIDLSQATQDLTINGGGTAGTGTFVTTGHQQWTVASGRTLTLAAVPIRNGGANNDLIGGTLTVATTGTVRIGTIAMDRIIDGGNNPFVTYGASDWAATDATGTVIAATYTNSSAGLVANTNVNIDSDVASGNLDIRSLRFADQALPRTLTINGGSTFTARGILVAPGTLDSTINGGFVRPARASTAGATLSIIQNSVDGNLTIGSSIPNASSNTPVAVAKSGPGRLILNGGNGYSGRTFVNAGTLQLGTGGTTGTLFSTAPIIIAKEATFAVNHSDNVALNNTISGEGGVTQMGTGQLTLGGFNSYTGPTNLMGGTLNLNALSNIGNGMAINFGGGTLRYGAAVDADISTRTVTFGVGGGTIDTNGNMIEFTGSIGNAGVGGFTKVGAGTLALANGGNYAGPTVVNDGTLLVNSALAGGGGATVNSGGVLGGIGSVSGSTTVNANGLLSPGLNLGTLTFGALTLAADSVLNFDFATTPLPTNDQLAVTNADGLTINGGKFNFYQLNTLTAFGTPGTYQLFTFAGAIQGTGLSTFSVLNPAAGFDYAFGTSGNAVTLTIVAAGLLTDWTAPGGGTWGNNASWSNTAPNQIGATANFKNSITAPGVVTLDGNKTVGAITFNSAQSYTIAQGTSGSLTIQKSSGAGQAMVVGGGHIISAPVILGSDLAADVADGGVLTISGAVSGAKALMKTGLGTLVLSNAGNSYSMGTTVSGGVLEFSGLASLGTGNLDFQGGQLRWATENTDDISARVVTMATGGATFDTNGNNIVFANPIGNAGAGGLTKVGAGSLELQAANTYSGSTRVNAGVLRVSSNGNLGDEAVGAGVTIDGGTLETTLSMPLDSFGASARTVTIGPAGGTIRVAESTTLSAAGQLAGTGVLTMGGAGVLILTANNVASFTGSYQLDAGDLTLGGAQPNGQQAIGSGTGTIVFGGGTLTMNGHFTDNAAGWGTLVNPISVPFGQTGSLNMTTRGVLTSTLTGEGTFNLKVNFTRGDVLPNWSGFTGQINVSSFDGAGDDFRIAGFISLNIPNAKLALGDGVFMSQVFNPPTGTDTQTIHNIGELTGTAGAIIGGNPVSGRFANWSIGSLGTDSTFAGIIQNSTGAARLTKVGVGTLTLSGANSYTGLTDVNGGTLVVSGSLSGTTAVNVTFATLKIGASDALNDLALLTLNGGTFDTSGFSDTVGEMVLVGSGTIDLGAGASILRLANSSVQTWFGGLSILNWSGSPIGGGTDQIYFGSDNTGLTLDQLALVQFIDPEGLPLGTYNAEMLPTGELVAVPEPTSSLVLLGGIVCALGLRRFRGTNKFPGLDTRENWAPE